MPIFAGLAASARAGDSVCYGTPAKGRLEGGVALVPHGRNVSSYSALAQSLDRNYVHSRVAEVVRRAYAALASTRPQTVYVLGESGHARGGPFSPHRTHQNGLSVDFMVPIRDRQGKSIPLPTWPWNAYGYDFEFDKNARSGDFQID